MFQRFGDSALKVIEASRSECARLGESTVGSEHLLLALTRDADGIAARALSSMGIYFENVESELRRMQLKAGGAPKKGTPAVVPAESEEISLSEAAISAIRFSEDQCRYFGHAQVRPEHLLLGIVDLKQAAAISILEELGANMAFLTRQVMLFMAQAACVNQDAPDLRPALINGIKHLICINVEATERLGQLSTRSRIPIARTPDRAEIVHMVIVGYLPAFLSTQIAFQRYLLQQTMRILTQRTGPLDQELTATLVSNGAQHLRAEARATIECLWSHEYRLFDQMLDEAEHDLIGSVIEDLWWAQSEEIALHDLFDAALDDHRRTHVLSLQKRRIELSQRMTKLKARLAETIQQCFSRRSISA